MFERFTDRARRVVVLAQEEARRLDHNYIGTEHLLLGLIHEGEGVAAKALQELKISLEAVRQEVEEMIGRGAAAPSGHIPFTPRSKKVLELSLRESTQMGHNYIGTEHILLGLIREGEGVAAQVLIKLGADLNTVRQKVIRLLHGYRGAESSWLRPSRPRLDEISRRLTAIGLRLTTIEEVLGLKVESREMRRLDEQLARVAREKEAAIDAQDFERAAGLRNEEKDLESQRDAEEQKRLAEVAERHAGTVGGQLREEIEQLKAVLRSHDIDPDSEPPAQSGS